MSGLADDFHLTVGNQPSQKNLVISLDHTLLRLTVCPLLFDLPALRYHVICQGCAEVPQTSQVPLHVTDGCCHPFILKYYEVTVWTIAPLIDISVLRSSNAEAGRMHGTWTGLQLTHPRRSPASGRAPELPFQLLRDYGQWRFPPLRFASRSNRNNTHNHQTLSLPHKQKVESRTIDTNNNCFATDVRVVHHS